MKIAAAPALVGPSTRLAKDAEAADLKAALCERDDSNATLQGELDKLHAASRSS